MEGFVIGQLDRYDSHTGSEMFTRCVDYVANVAFMILDVGERVVKSVKIFCRFAPRQVVKLNGRIL